MELSLGLGLIAAGAVAFLTYRQLSKILIRRRYHKHRPPKGSRPSVRISYDEVIYDLSEELVRVNDSEEGLAVWIVVGPAHLLMTRRPEAVLVFSVLHPVPSLTDVRFPIQQVDEDWCRFFTLDEIRESYPELQQA